VQKKKQSAKYLFFKPPNEIGHDFFKFHLMIYHLSLANPHVWLAIQNDQIIYKIVDDNSIKKNSISKKT